MDHIGWEDTVQKWYEWLEHMKKKDEKENGGDASANNGKDYSECRRQGWTSPQNHEATDLEGRSGDPEEEDARLLDRCEAKRKEWAKHWQCDEEIQNMQNKSRRNEDVKKYEEAVPRLKEGDLEEVSELNKAKTGVGCDGFHPKRQEENSGTEWQVTATSLHDDVLLDS